MQQYHIACIWEDFDGLYVGTHLTRLLRNFAVVQSLRIGIGYNACSVFVRSRFNDRCATVRFDVGPCREKHKRLEYTVQVMVKPAAVYVPPGVRE